MNPRYPLPGAVLLARGCNRAEFLRDAIDAAQSPIRDRAVWQVTVAFLRLLEQRGVSGDWRVANLILWLCLGQVGERVWVKLTMEEICIGTGHAAESAKRHLKRLIGLGFVERRRRSRVRSDYTIPAAIMDEIFELFDEPSDSPD